MKQKKTKIRKQSVIGVALALAGVVFLIVLLYLAGLSSYSRSSKILWGVTFSPHYATALGLEWQQVYVEILRELRPQKLRLMTYWEDIEPIRGEYWFADVEFMLKLAHAYESDVLLVVGHKQPRWPECHHPDWWNELSADEQWDAQLAMVAKVVDHFKHFPAVKAWQVENEPFFPFGPDCPTMKRKLYAQEVALVKALDRRPVVATDSGEAGLWAHAATSGADVLGSTMYRVVYDQRLGYFTYPLPPSFYRSKAGLLRLFFTDKPVIGVELQAEPWFKISPLDTPLEEHYRLMNPNIFREYVQYAVDVGFPENYLWGVEWWYWLKQLHGDESMWESARELFLSSRGPN